MKPIYIHFVKVVWNFELPDFILCNKKTGHLRLYSQTSGLFVSCITRPELF